MPQSRSSKSPPIAPHLRPGYRPGDTSHITPGGSLGGSFGGGGGGGGVQQYYGRPGTPGSTIPTNPGSSHGHGGGGGGGGGNGGSRGGGRSGGRQQYYGRPGTPGSTIPTNPGSSHGHGGGGGGGGGNGGSRGGGRSGGRQQYYGRPGTPGSTIPIRTQKRGAQGLSVYRPDGSTANPTSAEGQQMTAAVREMKGRRYGKKPGQQSEQPVTLNPFGEFTKGMVEGVTDLAITGENIGRLATGKEMKKTTGNVLTKSIDTVIDAYSDDDPNDFKQIQQGFEKIGQDFMKNPARSVGRLMPEIAITVASVFAPPVAAAKWAPHAARVGTKAAKVAAKKPINRGQFALGDPVSFARANPNYVPTKVYTGSQTMEDIFGKGFVATARETGKAQQAWKNLVKQNTKTSNNILKMGNQAKIKQPHGNSRIFTTRPPTRKNSYVRKKTPHRPKPPTRQNSYGSGAATKLIVKHKTPRTRPTQRTGHKGTQTPKNGKSGQTAKTKRRRSGRGAAAGAGAAAGLSLAALWPQTGKTAAAAKSATAQRAGGKGRASTLFVDPPRGRATRSRNQYSSLFVDPPPGPGPGTGPMSSSTFINPPPTTTIPPLPPPWARFQFGGGSGGSGGGGGRGKKAFREWATAGVFESVAIGKHVDSAADNIEGYFQRKPQRKAAGASKKKGKGTTKRKATSNPFAGFWG